MHASILADHSLRSLALSIARNNVGAMRPEAEIIAAEGLSATEYNNIAQNPQFRKYVTMFEGELKESGFSFAAKCKVLAEDLLPNAYHMTKDPDVPAAVRAKLLENLVEWGDLKPKKDVQVAAGPGFSITINLPTDPKKVEKVEEYVEIVENSVEKPKKVPFLSFDEPDDYEYAGDDVYEY